MFLTKKSLLLVFVFALLGEVLGQQQQQQPKARRLEVTTSTRTRTETRTHPEAVPVDQSPTSLYYMAYRFADGIDTVVPNVQETFSCQGRDYGYYADVGNNCQIFHVCNPPDQQYSFFCPNQTLFDQRLLICQDQYTATPCSQAESWYVINQAFGVVGDPETSLEVSRNGQP